MRRMATLSAARGHLALRCARFCRLAENLQGASDERLGALQRRLSEAEARRAGEAAGRAGELEAARGRWAAESAELGQQLEVAHGFTQSLSQLPAPAVPPHVAAAMVSHVWARARLFACRARSGSPCRVVHQGTGRGVPASYTVDDSMETLIIEELVTPADVSSPRRAHVHRLREVRNVWVCADSELARCMHRVLRRGITDPDRVLLLDVPAGPVGLVVHSPQAREELLDGLAVLVAVQRVEREPELLGRCSPAGLRPPGLSLQAAHLSGPVCAMLARGGAGLVPPPESPKATRRALDLAARSLGMEELWRHHMGEPPRDTE
ncbi:unnamed protein product [Prorocentrum cordatum]|uniref:Uncharacterized protein n=1 Tax=Prorocentrum cordatum TaxID=2364126 RepID=A0ABN9TBT9_9DINO|nr:unnamed protein product [Polarella glacialis]